MCIAVPPVNGQAAVIECDVTPWTAFSHITLVACPPPGKRVRLANSKLSDPSDTLVESRPPRCILPALTDGTGPPLLRMDMLLTTLVLETGELAVP